MHAWRCACTAEEANGLQNSLVRRSVGVRENLENKKTSQPLMKIRPFLNYFEVFLFFSLFPAA